MTILFRILGTQRNKSNWWWHVDTKGVHGHRKGYRNDPAYQNIWAEFVSRLFTITVNYNQFFLIWLNQTRNVEWRYSVLPSLHPRSVETSFSSSIVCCSNSLRLWMTSLISWFDAIKAAHQHTTHTHTHGSDVRNPSLFTPGWKEGGFADQNLVRRNVFWSWFRRL